MSRKAAHNPVFVDRRPVKMQGRANIGPGAAGYPSDADCDTLKLGDVARLRRRTRTLVGSDDAPQSLKELLKKKGTGAIDALGKVEMCEWLRKGGRLTNKKRVRTEYTYADIQVKDAPLFSICPVTHKIMARPATISSGTTLEHTAAISLLAQDDPKDPLTGVAVDKGILLDNHNLALAIRGWAETHYALRGREIDPESKELRDKRKQEETERTGLARNVGNPGGRLVDRIFSELDGRPVFRRIFLTFVDDAYFSSRWVAAVAAAASAAAGSPDFSKELRLVADAVGAGAQNLAAQWIGVYADDTRWELWVGDNNLVIVTTEELQALLRFLAEQHVIHSMVSVPAQAFFFMKADWSRVRWKTVTSSFVRRTRTIKLVLSVAAADAGLPWPRGMPPTLWQQVGAGHRVFYIE